MDEPVKKCKGCRKTKSLDKFRPHAKAKDGHRNKCEECRRLDAQSLPRFSKEERKYLFKTLGTCTISKENTDFFKLGLIMCQDKVDDLQKALNVIERANSGLLEVLNAADQRDSKYPKIPE